MLAYTPSGGKVRIYAEGSSASIKWIFANTGDGITNEDLPLSSNDSTEVKNLAPVNMVGLVSALPSVKELVEAHGGQVSAESSPAETRIGFTLSL